MRVVSSSSLRAALLVAALACGASSAAAQDRPLQPGDPAPAFTLAASDGQTYSLAGLLGTRPIVIAWFPKAFATL
ncbi:MAG: hypothetical protein H6Q10_2451 [Acidobacteria bacterium]|nr:hypothetical protein [Acidobacteriota bacterium]